MGTRGGCNRPSGPVVEAPMLVLACGAYIPDALRRCQPDAPLLAELQVTRTRVLVLCGPVSACMLIALFEVGPHLVPFTDGGMVAGATVCIAYDNVAVAEGEPPPTEVSDLAFFIPQLAAHLPGLGDLARAGGIGVHTYVCHKLARSQAGAPKASERDGMLIDHGLGLLSVYAGKFTTAPLVGQQAAQHIVRLMGREHAATPAPTPRLPPSSHAVALPPYHDPATHTLRLEAGRLVTHAL